MDLQFLKTILPENDGWYYLVHLHRPDSIPLRDGKPEARITHRAVKIDSLASATHTALSYFRHRKAAATNGLFFTPWSYTVDYKPEGGNARADDTYKLTCQTLWLDVDIAGEGHASGYATREEALAAVTAGIGAKMPKPTYIVHTGGGYQFFWVLDTPMDVPTWLNAANRFEAYWHEAGLDFDPITRDHSRVLRLPGSDNMKTGTARPCTILGQNSIVSHEYVPLWPEATTVPSLGSQENIASLFQHDGTMTHDGVQSKFYAAEISQKCNIIKRIAGNNGLECDEPLWKDVLQVIKGAEDEDEWAHKLSSGHPSYSPEGTDAKREERAAFTFSPRCSTLRDHFKDNPCEGCPLADADEKCSPRRMGMPNREPYIAPVPQNHLPYQPTNIVITNQGTYQIIPSKKKDEPDKQRRLCSAVIMDIEALQREEFGADNPYLRLTYSLGGRVKSRTLDMSRTASGPECAKLFMEAGLNVTPDLEGAMKNALSSWQAALHQAGLVSEYNSKQGWVKEHNKIIGFSHGPCIFRTDGTVADSGVSDTGGEDLDFIPSGDLDLWKQATTAMLEGGTEAHAVILASAFAAPLVDLMGIEGLPAVLSFWCTGGSGKSTALRAARTVWAASDTNISSQASAVAAQVYLKQQPNLPLYWDEPRNDRFGTREQLREFLFMLTGGISKLRAKQTGEDIQRRFRPRTLAAVASNESLAAEVSATTGEAEGKRFLEIRMEELKTKTGDRAFKPLNKNYAVAGPVYAKYLANNLPHVEAQLDAMKEHVWKAIGSANEDRYYANCITALIVGAGIAAKLELVPFNTKDILAFLVDVVATTRMSVGETMATMTATEDVLRYVRDKDNFGWQVEHFSKRGSRQVTPVGTNHALQRGTWSYIVAVKDGVARVSKSEFKEWYQKKNSRPINWTGWEARAKGEGIWCEIPGRGQRSMAVNDHSFAGCERVVCIEVKIPELAANPLQVHTDKAIPSQSPASSPLS